MLLVCTLLTTGCSWFGSTASVEHATHKDGNISTASIQSQTAINAAEVDMLNNIKAYGFNSDPAINGGLGGLYINWRYGTNPLETNVNGTGETDEVSGQTLRHDDLTDLRYLHNLWSYKVQNPKDDRFQSEIERYTKIVRFEFANAHNERGWLYDEFMSIYSLSHDIFYRDAALSLVKNYAKTFDPRIGSIYKTNTTHQQGSYRVDLTLESGCALIQAGTISGNQEWIHDGNSIINFVYSHAYIARYHTFPNQIDNVLNPDGSVNQHEPFFQGQQKNYTVDGSHMQMGNISQIIISLLNTYMITHTKDFLAKATDLLDQLSQPTNPLGIWDTTYGGYYFSASFTGISPAQVDAIRLDKGRKEAGRQAIMLEAFHLADKFTNGKYDNMENLTLEVALKHIYNQDIHGVMYLVNANWTPKTFHNKTLNNMTTTEAMGAELESLFSLNS